MKKDLNAVSIVGAGPGDPELLTLRAYRRIEAADVILYDNLISKELLRLARAGCELIYVGKKYGDACDQLERQSAINEQLYQLARSGKKVVRLKSGDPFIFGRAAEEIRFLRSKEIPFEVIPGITAGIAAAGLLHIPLTERNHSSAVLFCTAHTAGYDQEQLNALAEMLRTGTTLVLYMGLKKLDTVLDRLKQAMAGEKIHVSAISKVSQGEQELVTGTLEDSYERIHKAGLQTPVVFIIGKHAAPIGNNPIDEVLKE